MFSFLRNRLGVPGIVSVIALVFAMVGGSFAADDNHAGDNGTEGKATASAKKGKKSPRGPRGPRGLKGPVGPAGPQGPAGPAGPAGAKGDAGANGQNGANGTNGIGVETATFTGPKSSCADGGIEVKSASPTALVCNGADGETGFTETLPPGKTETGAWAGAVGDEGYGPAAISFTIPLSASVALANTHILEIGDPTDTNCPGTAVTPEAAPGHLCVYVLNELPEIADKTMDSASGGPGAGTAGAILGLEGTSGAAASGSWAVTAPNP